MSDSHKKRILFVSPPFSGHLNVLKDLLASPKFGDIDARLVITGWSNVTPNLDGVSQPTTILSAPELNETDPALWTFPRVVQLLEQVISLAKDFKPDIIIYDFFSLEGYYAARLLDIPAWCSIPAFIGPYDTADYLADKLRQSANRQAREQLHRKYGIDVEAGAMEMVSDGILVPGDINLVWSYRSITPDDFMRGRADAPYVFVGSAKELTGPVIAIPHERPRIYLSFGTVVMDNLWNQQPATHERLRHFFMELAALWQGRPWDVVFVTQGKQVLDRYPSNWQVHDRVDQLETLLGCDVFVSHGGSNSFHESVISGVPMAIIPFFGDQILVAEQSERLGIGVNLVRGGSIDTQDEKSFLDDSLAVAVDHAVTTMLDDYTYASRLQSLDLAHSSISDLLTGTIPFEEGDLLFGTNVARRQYVESSGLTDEFRIMEFTAFSELAPRDDSLPRIVDIYHDVILNDEYFAKDSASELAPYTRLLSEYKEYLGGETDFEQMCIKGIEFFTRRFHIHFLLSDFDPAINRITRAEITYIVDRADRLASAVTFYLSREGIWVPVAFDTARRMIG